MADARRDQAGVATKPGVRHVRHVEPTGFGAVSHPGAQQTGQNQRITMVAGQRAAQPGTQVRSGRGVEVDLQAGQERQAAPRLGSGHGSTTRSQPRVVLQGKIDEPDSLELPAQQLPGSQHCSHPLRADCQRARRLGDSYQRHVTNIVPTQ